ncbi:MAG: hypothetical protein KatS3mg014_2533 [Actinomycetota bacterium]|nr:MAG: hypothetical protein KatS3mg014_2472 [Actinomycetota bacterium]GIV00918.1 MAG: hypothetical protein KatS3mg014_2533 [Actinomycetota bacterium]
MSRSGALFPFAANYALIGSGTFGDRLQPGQWWPPAVTTNGVPNEADLRTIRVLLPPCTIAALLCEVTAAGSTGALVRLGIYAPDPATGLPGALLRDAGTVSGQTTGFKEAVLATPLVHDGGPLWFARVVQGGAATKPELRNVTQPWPTGGSPDLGGGSGWVHAGPTTGALPDPAPAVLGVALHSPFVWVRVA